MTEGMSNLALEAGVVVAFGAAATVLALLFARKVIARLGVGWVVGVLILAGAAVVAVAVLWLAQGVLVLLDPPEVVAAPDTGSGALDLALLPVFIVAQAGAGLEHLYAVLVAAVVSALIWLGVTGAAALRWWRGSGQGVEGKR
jgi:hypothetical protein